MQFNSFGQITPGANYGYSYMPPQFTPGASYTYYPAQVTPGASYGYYPQAAQPYYYPPQVPPGMTWTTSPPATYPYDPRFAGGRRWVSGGATCPPPGWAATTTTWGPPAAAAAATVAVAPSPYKIADGSTAITIHYEFTNIGGQHGAVDGTPADSTRLAVELNGQATGPARVRIDVFAEVANSAGPVPITSFYSVRGLHGVYTVGAADMSRLAREYILWMSRGANYDANHPVPAATLTLYVRGDDPDQVSPTIPLYRVATLTPQPWNVP